MVTKKYASPSYAPGERCVFTNRGSSSYIGNDGKECLVRFVKPTNMWASPEEPEYGIKFVGENHGFGVRECELKANSGQTKEK